MFDSSTPAAGGLGGMSPYLRLALQALAGGFQGTANAQRTGARGFGAGLGPGAAGGLQYGLETQQADRRNRLADQQDKYLQSKIDAETRDQQDAANLKQQTDAYIATLPPDQQQMARLAPKEVIAAQVAKMYPKPEQQPDLIREYEYAKAQNPQIGSFDDWNRRTKAAGATSVSVGGPVVNMPKPLQAGPEQMAKEGATAYDQARDTIPLFGLARDAAKRFPQSGTGGKWSLAWERGKNWLGLPNNAQAGEVLQGVQTRLGVMQRLPGSGATSDMEMSLYMQAVPSLLNSQKGNIALADIGEKLARRRMKNYEGWAKHYMQTNNPFDYQPDDTPLLTKEETQLLLGAANEGSPAAAAPAAGGTGVSDDDLLKKYGVQ